MPADKKRVSKKVPAKKVPAKKRVRSEPELARVGAAEARLMGVTSVRERKSAKPKGSAYFASGAAGKDGLQFISSGCALLDEALGGGYVRGRVANIVGDKSAGKTLSAMELATNFAITLPDAVIRYAESEAAFDQAYARALGTPIDRFAFNQDGKPMETVEDLYEDMTLFLDANKGVPKLYIIDSLDALSTDTELAETFNEASYGGGKPKAIGQLFRRLVQRMQDEDMTFFVVSQIRAVLNARPFQEQTTRSGGKALDFYCTHIVWLNEIGKITAEIAKIKRVVGVDVKARVRKNKVGMPHREAAYPILFGYGIDDMTASADWLKANFRGERLKELGMSEGGYSVLIKAIRNRGGVEAREMRAKLAAVVRQEWQAVETTFLPTASKY